MGEGGGGVYKLRMKPKPHACRMHFIRIQNAFSLEIECL